MNFNTSHLKSYIKSSISNTSHLKLQLSAPLPSPTVVGMTKPLQDLSASARGPFLPAAPPHPETSQPPPESYFKRGHGEANAPQSYFWCTFGVIFLKTSTPRPPSKIQKKIDRKYDLQKCHFRPNPEIQKKIDSKYKLDPILGGVWKFHFLYFFPASVPNCTLKPIFRPSPGTRLGPGGGLAALWQAALRLAGSRLSWHLLAACLPGACNPLGLEAQRGFVISMRVLPSLTPPAARGISGLGRSIAVRNCL